MPLLPSFVLTAVFVVTFAVLSAACSPAYIRLRLLADLRPSARESRLACKLIFRFSVRVVTYTFRAVGPQTVSLSQTIVSTGRIKQIEASVMVKVSKLRRRPAPPMGSLLVNSKASVCV